MRVAGTSALDPGRIALAFERAPALVDRLRAAGRHETVDDVMDEAARLIGGMSEDQRIALLGAHPRIGADPSGLSDASAREQGGEAGAATMGDLASLNAEYERRFGFRFVVFVAGRPKSAMVPILRERLAHDRETEMAIAISELLAIARDRLADAGGGPGRDPLR